MRLLFTVDAMDQYEILNACGKDGWELVAIIADTNLVRTLYLKKAA